MPAPDEFDAPADAGTFERFDCPGCTEDVDVPIESAGKLVRCPYCSTDFFASAEQSNEPVVDDTEADSDELDREAAFDSLRIRNHAKLRMSAIRSRSLWLMAMILAIVVVLDMFVNAAIDAWGFHSWIWTAVRVVVGIPAVMFVRHAYRRAAEWQRESEKSSLADPTAPPDFSTLNDGTERWKELENIR